MKKAFVVFYCDVGEMEFPKLPWSPSKDKPTSEEVFKFLMSDTNFARGSTGHKVKGDKIIWTLTTNTGTGRLMYLEAKKDDSNWREEEVAKNYKYISKWGCEEKHDDILLDFINVIYQRKFLLKKHYDAIVSEIKFAKENFKSHHDIGKYLSAPKLV